MDVERLDDAADFLRATEGLRAADPIRTNVLGSVATMQATRHVYDGECFWWVVRDAGEVVGMAMRTTPWSLSLSPMPAAAAAALAGAVVAADPHPSGVSGFVEVVDAYLEASERCGGPGRGDVTRTMDQLAYEARAIRLPDVAGEAVVATGADAPHLVEWFVAFRHEAEGAVAHDDHELREMARRSIEEGRLTVWRLDGEAVSMAGNAVPVETPGGTVTRVGPVYTPPEWRRRGYGGAVTAAVSRRVLEEGARVMLFTDASNPTSNHVYQDLGYELLDRFVHHTFAGPPSP